MSALASFFPDREVDPVRRHLPFLLPFLLVLVLAAPAAWWMSGDGRPMFEDPEWAPVPLAQLDPTVERFVEVTAMSHYAVVVKQEVPGNLLRSAETRYLFPLFEAHDVESRAVKVLVQTNRKPARFVSYEFMTVRGPLGLATTQQVPFGTEELFGRKGYYFADEVLVIEAESISEAPVPALSAPKGLKAPLEEHLPVD